jgi:hypothetical protein
MRDEREVVKVVYVRKCTLFGNGQCANADSNNISGEFERMIGGSKQKNKRAIEIALASRLCDHSKLKI